MKLDSIERRLRHWAGFLLVYTILVILWGAWVRISHSGDGCGDTWPLCNGQLIPEAARGKTWVEYGHRFTSGLYGLVVIAIYIWVRILKRHHSLSSAHRWMFWTLIFMITEAALGAKLVLFGLVSSDQSVWRLIVMSLHQLNSFLLVAFTVRFYAATFESEYLAGELTQEQSTVLFASSEVSETSSASASKFLSRPLFLAGFLLIAITGAWAALSTTLFPSTSLLDGFTKDVSSDSHIVLKIRGLHPVLGLLIGGSLSVALYRVSSKLNLFLGRVAMMGSALIASGIVVGLLTLFLLSPVPLKLIHLLLAHALWSTSVFFYHFYGIRRV